ncbi:MAG: histidine phosphatase family protein [Aliiglaciecola sp.]|uniref:histidine phosphatase family protein n=1 Tax=Aliiglaciecola sp. TaxID=1872441 RepID=UPI00329738E2
MSIYLVRHGETDGNRNRIVQTPETPLSAHGHLQAQELADAYQNHQISRILCSDHTRTQQTAKPVQQLLGCELVLTELLQERNLGALRGTPWKQIDFDFLAADYHPENGESQPQFGQRVELAWQQIIQQANEIEQSLMVITHGLVLRYILQHILQIDEASLERSGIENTCVTQIDKQDFSNIKLLCDIAHLRQEVVKGTAI